MTSHRPGPTPFVLCADDYALSPGVSRAILGLIGRGRLSATGCMTVSPFWPEHAAWLRAHAGAADIGLHLTLTDQRALGPLPALAPEGRLPPLGRLMALALARAVDPREVAAEIDRQIAAFQAHLGRFPDFVDGHQHVHQLPVVRDALAARLAGTGAYVRLCAEPAARILRRGVAVPKALLIARLGGGLARLARRAGIPHNRGFSGVYDLSGKEPFAPLMERFVTGIRPGALVMCHPGFPDAELAAVDPVTAPRRAEHDYLAGDAFPAMLEARGLRVARLSG